ncbi:MAG: nucleoside-diphosphate sugar epimerase/dehydratase [Phycisphaerae bacterium]|jgi:FlaA1/EpsC-like NDP-sugar epimerase
MPDSNENTQIKDDNQNTSELSIFMRYRKFLIIFAHIVAFAASLMLAFLVANNMQFRRDWLTDQYPPLLFFFILIKLVVFGFFRQYRGWWRYVGISDLIGILRASLVSTLIIVALWTILLFAPTPIRQKLQSVTFVGQSVFMVDLFTTFLLLAGLRMLIRLYHEEFRTVESGRLKRLLIVGAGNTGVTLLGDIHKKQVAEYEVIGFIDDDANKRGTFILGLPVIGAVEELPKICKDRDIEEIAIAMPSASHRQRRRVIQMCEGIKIRFNTVPSYSDIVSGKLRVSQIRNVEINDLLGREAVELDLQSIEAFLKNKVIFVSGAGGSIGSEMCRQVCLFGPKLLLLVEQSENPLFYIERELRTRFPALQIKAIICDITDKTRVEEIFDKFRPEVVIHAAAHKHVPLMELNPGEAIKNNVVGTQTVSNAADHYGSTNFVMISTDKAVNPTSIMGSSKRIAEMYVQDLAKTSKTQFVTVRFGNVLDSEGSVVPIFKKQIAEGGPVTVTHPDMKRYFMTIPEASQLVLQAASMGKGGEIFVLDMGEPVKIVDLAKELITLSGFSPDEDIEIKFTGMRPGEKLFEELSIAGEDMQPTGHPKIAIWRNIIKDREKLRAGINELVTIAKSGSCCDIIKKVKEVVPTYIGETNGQK